MERWVEHLEVLSSGIDTVNSAINEAANEFMSSAVTFNPQIASTVGTLTHRMSNSSDSLAECLSDLTTMSMAMKDAMVENPEEAPSLMSNLFNVLLQQLLVYYKDTSDSLQEVAHIMRRQRSNGSVSTVSVSSPRQETKQNLASNAVSSSASMAVSTTSVPKPPVEEKKKKKKNRDNTEAAGTTLAQEDNALQLPPPTEAAREEKPKKSKSSKNLESEVDSTVEVTKAKKAPPVQEPAYMHVMTNVDDALGRLVLSSRPNVFTPPETISQRTPILSYFIALPNPGCLGPLLLLNYIALDEDMQADLMCDVLLTDYVEVEPFESPAGEIIVDDPNDLRGIPACGWRLGASEDRQTMLYTTYVLVHRDSVSSRSLLVQDSLVTGSTEREEVLHVITPLASNPLFAKVTAHGFSPSAPPGSITRKYTSDRVAAIVGITKSTFEKNGFREVREEETRGASPTKQLMREDLLTKPRGASANFHGTVELASLDGPSAQTGWGLSDVAMGAVRGAAAVVKAPVSMGMVVGSAVLDVSGVTGAIKNQTDGMFRKSFPHLSEEEIIDTFNCAVVEEGNSIPKQGFLFITSHWLCFQASLLSTKISLEWDEIKNVQKQKTAKVLENAINVSTHLGNSYFFTSFVQRDQAYSLIMKQWLRK